MVKPREFYSILCWILLSQSAWAVDAIEVDSWYKSFLSQVNSEQIEASNSIYAQRLMILEKAPKKNQPTLLRLDRQAFEAISFFSLVSEGEVDLAWRLNHKMPNWGQPAVLLSANRADAMLYRLDESLWAFEYRNNVGFLEKKKCKDEFDQDETDQIGQMLRDCLGYNAVVLDRRDDLVLLKTPSLVHTRSLQALLLKNSRERMIVPATLREGMGLMTLVKGGDQFGVFRITVQDYDADIAFGTKVVLGLSGEEGGDVKGD